MLGMAAAAMAYSDAGNWFLYGPIAIFHVWITPEPTKNANTEASRQYMPNM